MMMWLWIVQKGKVLGNKKENEGKRRIGDGELKIKVWVFKGTCNRKPQTMFWYSINFKCCFEIFLTKHGIML